MLSFLDPSPKPICIELEASELIVSVHRLWYPPQNAEKAAA